MNRAWLIERMTRQPAWQLGGLGLLAMGALWLLQALTADRIAAHAEARLRDTLASLVPTDTWDNDPLRDTGFIRDARLGQTGPVMVYRLRQRGEPVAAVLPVTAPDGYSGAIRLLVAIRPDGRVAGARVLEHRETPGLGDGIEIGKSDWIGRFAGRSLQDPSPGRWAVRRDGGDFDQFAGATITPRAVVRALREALAVFARDREAIFPVPIPATGATPP